MDIGERDIPLGNDGLTKGNRVYRDLTPDERRQYNITDTDPTCARFGAPAYSIPPTATPIPVSPAIPPLDWVFPRGDLF